MLRLYYSGGIQTGQIQSNPDQSLGGYMSASPIPNDLLSGLFGTVSEKGIAEQLSETKAVFIRNEGSEALENITLYCVLPLDVSCKYEFSPVVVANQKSMERITSVRAAPFYADFFEANDPLDPEVLVETLAAGEIFGLWIRRTVLPRLPIPEDVELFTLWYAIYEQKVENIEMVFGWD